MEIYNTLTRKKESFEPLPGKKINMFVCGPTVYDHIHIGNAQTFVFFDVVAKYLKYKYGYENVRYIQNITDIDNKIIERAQKEGVDPLEYAKKYSDIFKQDMQALGVTSPEYKNATDHIPEVIKQVQTLLDKGNAYVIENDGIYFDLATFPDYGKLSGRTASMADDAVSRIDDSDKKRNRGDFALWKFSQKDDPSWPAPFGDGRPGWHIEDTAITEKYFGPQYDIHGGGQDLIFPHHEAEIAQQESASGLKPFVRYWMHSGFLINKDHKMSKSLENFETLNNLLSNHATEILRHYLLTNAHYRTPLQFTTDSIDTSKTAINNLRELIAKLKNKKPSESSIVDFDEKLRKSKENFYAALDDDFNIPESFGFISSWCSYLNTNLNKISNLQINDVYGFFEEINNLLGIIPQDKLDLETKEQQNKINKLRSEEKYEEADKLKIELRNKGFYVSDTGVSGTIVIPGVIIPNKEKQTK